MDGAKAAVETGRVGGERERWATPSLLSLEGADMVALQQGASLKFCRKIKVTPVESKRGKGKWN